MSKILESIDDAVRYAGWHPNADEEARCEARATAARAEHAEIVERLRDAAHALRLDCPTLSGELSSLLSRIAPERGA